MSSFSISQQSLLSQRLELAATSINSVALAGAVGRAAVLTSSGVKAFQDSSRLTQLTKLAGHTKFFGALNILGATAGGCMVASVAEKVALANTLDVLSAVDYCLLGTGLCSLLTLVNPSFGLGAMAFDLAGAVTANGTSGLTSYLATNFLLMALLGLKPEQYKKVGALAEAGFSRVRGFVSEYPMQGVRNAFIPASSLVLMGMEGVDITTGVCMAGCLSVMVGLGHNLWASGRNFKALQMVEGIHTSDNPFPIIQRAIRHTRRSIFNWRPDQRLLGDIESSLGSGRIPYAKDITELRRYDRILKYLPKTDKTRGAREDIWEMAEVMKAIGATSEADTMGELGLRPEGGLSETRRTLVEINNEIEASLRSLTDREDDVALYSNVARGLSLVPTVDESCATGSTCSSQIENRMSVVMSVLETAVNHNQALGRFFHNIDQLSKLTHSVIEQEGASRTDTINEQLILKLLDKLTRNFVAARKPTFAFLTSNIKVSLVLQRGGGWQETITAVDDALAFDAEIWDRSVVEVLLMIKTYCQQSLVNRV